MNDEPHEIHVRGVMRFPVGAPARAAAVVVRVQDVSRADAPSVTVGEQGYDDVELPDPDGGLEFDVAVPTGLVERGRRYTVRAHVDVAGTGDVTRGDYVSTASYPVLTTGAAEPVVIQLRKV